MRIKSLRLSNDILSIAYMTVEDVLYMSENFAKHTDVLYKIYDFDSMDRNEAKLWLKWKNGIFNAYFAIRLLTGECIGYIGLKNISIFKKNSVLGLCIGPDFAGNGYATSAMELFLSGYFNELNMKSMELEVTSYNARAQALYKRLGFVEDVRYMEFHDDDSVSPSDVDVEKYEGLSVYEGRLTSYIYHMNLKREDFFRRKRDDISIR